MKRFELTETGYRFYIDDVVIVNQTYDPEKHFIDGEGQPFDSPEAAEAHARASGLLDEAA